MIRRILTAGCVAALTASCSPEADGGYREEVAQETSQTAEVTPVDGSVTSEALEPQTKEQVIDRLISESISALRQDLDEGDARVAPMEACLAWPEASGGITIVSDPVQYGYETPEASMYFVPFLRPEPDTAEGYAVMNGPSIVLFADGTGAELSGAQDVSSSSPQILPEAQVESVSLDGFRVTGYDKIFGHTAILTIEQARSVLSIPAGCSYDLVQELLDANTV